MARVILVSFSFVAGAMGALSFTADKEGDRLTNNDSLIDKYGFKSLFIGSRFDASKPYASQLNPRAVSFVQEYVRQHGKNLEKMRSWGKPYFDLYDNILAVYGLPVEMKYLSVIESNLSSGAVSWAGAGGPWQIMPYEARRLGLRVGAVDDRTDYYKSTHAAARIMKELYKEFGDWLLVVAAYNCGSGRVRQAIRKSNSRDFWDLQYYLPEETRNHVKKFIGTHFVFEGSGGWTTMTAGETLVQKSSLSSQQEAVLSTADSAISTTIEIGGRYNSLIVANGLAMNIAQFHQWNPGFDKALSEGKKYFLRIPRDKEAIFQARKNELLMSSVRALLEGSIVSK